MPQFRSANRWFAAWALALTTPHGWGATSLADMELEDLGKLRITSVSKQSERLADASASVFVITAEDIRRSGASTLPEALRLAPNLQVAWISASQYAIGARGFNGFRSNKLLVMIDGRAIYSPVNAIVFWDQHMVVLEDVERIEVISGPGSTLWGANAVNGVINITTRKAADTQGDLVVAGVGTPGNELAFRHGGTIGPPDDDEAPRFRVFGQYLDRVDSKTLDGRTTNDGYRPAQVGGRLDGGTAQDQWSLLGNLYQVSADQATPGFFVRPGTSPPLYDRQTSGGNLTGQWTRRLDDSAELQVQAYLDHSSRDLPGALDDNLDLIDLQAQHAFQLATDHRLVWGASYRWIRNEAIGSAAVAMVPSTATQSWSSVFAQDEWALYPQVKWTLGARVEANPYTRPELLPSTRLAWKPSPEHLVWGAVTRSVRTPARIDVDIRFPATPPYLQAGSPDFLPEVVWVYELGYRGQIGPRLSQSLTVFRAQYDNLLTLESGVDGNRFANHKGGSTQGIEWWATYQATAQWRLSAGGSTLSKDLRVAPGVVDVGAGTGRNGNDPELSWSLRSNHTLSDQWALDAVVRHVSALPDPHVRGYTVADLRLGWKPRPWLEWSLSGTNLFSGRHEEFALPTVVNPRATLGPGVSLKLISRF